MVPWTRCPAVAVHHVSTRVCASARSTTTLDLRPVYHRREDRIRAHVLLCWLGLLLIRVAETGTGQTRNKIRIEVERVHIGTFTGPAGSFSQRTELSQPQKVIYAKLKITEPPRVLDATPTAG